ncbi:MAG TPA: DUF3052 family protein [Paucimonas sp.]|nr:DUF3052 family protein [Paucimonas sp.]
MAGYSGTPLAKKLGIKEDCKILAIDAPVAYRDLLAPLPGNVEFVARLTNATDIVHVFADKKAGLQGKLAQIRARLKPDGMIWVSWPKKSSKVPTDITEDTIRDIALPLGLVDVKVCAIDETWSGLKLVIRKELR